ncbi:hypothetical protein HYV43_01175 [Candidatus Micrarchaeota archaeon]|nr:hypothetical protein [Candidatus Micrarchaeota archaeon]
MEGTWENLKKKAATGRHYRPRFQRGQAAIFDGVNLLLLAAISSALIFSFVTTYGTQQDRVLRSAYILNYMQSVVKASYYIDASTLRNIDNRESTVNRAGNPATTPLEIYRDLADPVSGCKGLEKYSGSFSVTELLKRDLAEFDAKLDDEFDGTKAAGITAYKCAVKELMKPFWYAGFYYGFDVIDTDSADGAAVRVMPKGSGEYLNSRLITDYPRFLRVGAPSQFGICAGAKDVSPDVVTVQVPFKVIYVNTAVNPPDRKLRSYALSFCIWHPDPNAP